MDAKLTVSSTPHVRSNDTIEKIMRDVLIALTPALIMAVYYFGFRALAVMVLSVAAAVGAEALYQKLTKQTITIRDCSAAITGLLLAFNLPYTVPFWLPVVGSFFAIIIAKQLFGGLGQNFINPALAARAFLLTSYPVLMTDWGLIDGVTAATPLAMLKEGGFVPQASDYINALIGNRGGSIGETCVAALVLGGIYLLVRKVISWRVPATFIGTVFILSWVLGRNGAFTGYALYEILTGGLMLGAFFMATDYSSSPVTPLGQLYMGIGCGILTVVIRVYGGYPEGVSYAILIMNLAVPLIDRYTKPRVYGVRKVKSK